MLQTLKPDGSGALSSASHFPRPSFHFLDRERCDGPKNPGIQNLYLITDTPHVLEYNPNPYCLASWTRRLGGFQAKLSWPTEQGRPCQEKQDGRCVKGRTNRDIITTETKLPRSDAPTTSDTRDGRSDIGGKLPVYRT